MGQAGWVGFLEGEEMLSGDRRLPRREMGRSRVNPHALQFCLGAGWGMRGPLQGYSSLLSARPPQQALHPSPGYLSQWSLPIPSFTTREGDGTPLQYSCLENPMDRGVWWAAVHGVAKSWTRLSDFTFMHWRRKWQPTPVFLPGESQGRGSLVGCPQLGRTESDTTEAT